MVNGTVKWFNGRKGYGFITSDEGVDAFVHFSAISGDDDKFKNLNENDKVDYEVVDGEKGPQATNVVVTEAAAPSQNYDRRFRD